MAPRNPKQTYFRCLLIVLMIVFVAVFSSISKTSLSDGTKWKQQPEQVPSNLYDDLNDDNIYNSNNHEGFVIDYNDGDMMNYNGNGPFFENHCQMTHDESQWMVPDPNWQSRTPYFLLIGAKKAGTTTLFSWLRSHPQIVSGIRKELLYFLPDRFERISPETGKVQVEKVRQDLYQDEFVDPKTRIHPDTIAFEATPGYLFLSTKSRISILCSVPWVKLLVTLRDPVDRCFSNYNFLLDYQVKRKGGLSISQKRMKQNNGTVLLMHLGKTLSFEEMVEMDFADLRESGVIQDVIPPEKFAGSAEEQEAWTRYQEMDNGMSKFLDRPVGRSLYVLQILEWQRGLREIGRDPATEMLIVRNEDMKRDPHTVFKEIIWWLELPSHELEVSKDRMVTNYRTSPMKNETRKMLHHFFEPYNQRLYHLLGWDKTKIWRTD